MPDSPTGAIRIELVDDHLLVRSGLRLLIEGNSRFQVVCEASSATDAIALAARDQPDLILLDLDLGRESGLDCLPRLRQVAPNARVLVLTGLRDTQVHREAVRLGASGILLKDQAADLLIRAIERVHAGECWLDRTTSATLLAELASGAKSPVLDPDQKKIQTLTKREREVIALISKGLRNQQVADRLHVSEATVRHHLTSIFEKLEVPDRLALTIYAFRHGLDAPEPRQP